MILINIVREIKENEQLKQRFIHLASARRLAQLGYNEQLFRDAVTNVTFEDAFKETSYSMKLFDDMMDFLFTGFYHYILADFINEGAVLPVFVSEYPDLQLDVEYKTVQIRGMV
ncbi:hypothetical protein [Niallia taxi]|uniref:hypothetical protein n=1 Tax=Niallia taxi TaxID=2499688 RepID=UPI0015F4BE4E|nr:hypothetical protein [Niallia taxi]